MGNFCTVRDVRLALAPAGLSEGQQDPTQLDDWQIEDAIAEAEGQVMTYIGARYTVTPVSTEVENPDSVDETWTVQVAPSPVRGWTRNVAAWLVSLTYRRSKDIGEDDPIRLRYNMTLDLLKDVRDGKSDLALPGVNDTSNGSGVEVVNLYDGQLFGMEDVGLGYDTGHTQRLIASRDRWI